MNREGQTKASGTHVAFHRLVIIAVWARHAEAGRRLRYLRLQCGPRGVDDGARRLGASGLVPSSLS